MKPLTRIAPTPSGFLHKGNVFSFLLTQRLAKEIGADVLLRIDDIDNERFRIEYVNDIFNTLFKMKMEWQVGPHSPEEFIEHWSQLTRKDQYNKLLDMLVATGRVYACSCSRKDLSAQQALTAHTCRQLSIPLDSPNVAWRFRIEPTDLVEIRIFGHQNQEVTVANMITDPVVRKRDGVASYQVASLADDLYFGVTHIVRGQDLWPSTLFQLLMAQVVGAQHFSEVEFVHHSLLANAQGEKLSKSAGAAAFRSKNEATSNDVLHRLREQVNHYQW